MTDPVDAVFISAPNLSASGVAYQVYDAQTGTSMHTYKGLLPCTSTLAISESGLVLSGCKERSILQAWRLDSHETEDVRLVLPSRPACLAVPQGDPYALLVGIAESIHVYSLSSGCKLATLTHHYQPITKLQFLPCGNFFISAGLDGYIYLWSMSSIYTCLATGEKTQNIKPEKLGQHNDKVTDLSVGGHRLATASTDHTVRVYDLLTRALLHTVLCDSEVSCVDLCPSQTSLLVGLEGGQVAVVDLAPYHTKPKIKVTGEMLTACHASRLQGLRFLHGGTEALTAGTDGSVDVWSIVRSGSSGNVQLSGNAVQQVYRLSHLRNIHKNKGAVTNLAVVATDRRVFSSWPPKPRIVSLNSEDVMAAPVLVCGKAAPLDLNAILGSYCFDESLTEADKKLILL